MAIYWLEKSAKNGNATAQGTLADLYKQGIGVPQDYVVSYVWSNLSVASQLRFNKKMQTGIGRGFSEQGKKYRDNLYENLSILQRNEAQRLLHEYSQNYFLNPSKFDLACSAVQSTIALNNAMRSVNNLVKNYGELYKNENNNSKVVRSK